MLRTFLLFSFLVLTASFLKAQNSDPVLFTVGGKPVTASEFKYIYGKTNGEKADFSQKSIEEYLSLYVKFKRKVLRAHDMKLDTIESLKNELAGYRQQLANTYLVDKEVTETLIKEAYERSRQDVEFSHILIGLSRNATPKDTAEAYQKALDVKKRLDKGENFDTVAREVSNDQTVKSNGGYIGWVNAMLPNGFYRVESALYNTPKGKITNPVRSDLGYHILFIKDWRPARGEMEVAHIMALGGENAMIKSRFHIDSAMIDFKTTGNFEETARKFSDDKMTAPKGGYIGWFGIGQYEPAFENAAFELEKDGDVSGIIQTSVGWHIIKRISRKSAEAFDNAKRRLKPKIQKDSRYELANQAMLVRIKREGEFKEETANLEAFAKTLNEDFVTYKWKAPEGDAKSKTKLFGFKGGQDFNLGDFTDFLGNNSRKRLGYPQGMDLNVAVQNLYKDFVQESCMKYEERQLDTKYPEFKSLMREYEEGILLFEATKLSVWDKASQDSAGLFNFHKMQADKYKWDTRAETSIYALKEDAKDKIEDIQKLARKKAALKVLSKFNKDGKEILTFQNKTVEKGKNKIVDAMTWAVGETSPVEIDKRNGNALTFIKIEKIIPPTIKTLQEARGYVVADYQEFLEKKWMDELEKKYPVEINKEVLSGLAKK
jgi:peptidyl-prolyl cis-trans isomerase SurA